VASATETIQLTGKDARGRYLQHGGLNANVDQLEYEAVHAAETTMKMGCVREFLTLYNSSVLPVPATPPISKTAEERRRDPLSMNATPTANFSPSMRVKYCRAVSSGLRKNKASCSRSSIAPIKWTSDYSKPANEKMF
jgi:hypothetical protein